MTDTDEAVVNAVHPDWWSDLDTKAVDTARLLAADAVQKAGDGHPGTAMSLAPLAYLLYQRVMRLDPNDPQWVGRDRFILSNGHASLTQYCQLFLSGYGLELSDLKALRMWESRTPGHPEYHHTAGVEITTGPLGQGLANGVGMAMAARRERGLFDPDAAPGESPFDHHIYVIAGDGCMEEGVTAEASSLAGHQQLGNLTVFYDDNHISIEDDTAVAFSEDVAKRYEAYGWHVQYVESGEDVVALENAIEAANAVTDKPSLIVVRTIIGWPAPTLQNTGKAHGSALGTDEIAKTKEILGFPTDVTFHVPDDVLDHARKVIERGRDTHERWQQAYDEWAAGNPAGAELHDRLQTHTLPSGWTDSLVSFPVEKDGKPNSISTRKASGDVLTGLADVLPELWGGSADLAGSNNTTMEGEPSFVPAQHQTKMWPGGPYGRTLHFGIREHAMGAIINGIAVHGGTRPYGGTFLVFSDYMRPPVRLAALMKLPSTFVWTHDSIGVGGDGPTHQPIEHLASLRAIPGLDVVRPADANETAVCWRQVLENYDRPAAFALSRQNLPVLDPAKTGDASRGAYVLADATVGRAEVILIATGSEVALALAAREALEDGGTPTRVVSMPCVEWFEAEPSSYRQQVLPPEIKARVSIEAAVKLGWREWIGDAGVALSVEHFGASAPGDVVYEQLGFTPDRVVAAAHTAIQNASDLAG
ncbi:transketolase [Jatrophihabitans endophyticus]|uniref:Transketolase n=1 Tax=Jatrophihabitans endophyticus TaxID=1206085 RepID=A0A1M5N019_9ACTN|nr:transketolase [Jatrophihabitans endophyticus]SHG82881.1 transketolase [Jatrophihabitans endophyticus]